MIKRKRLQKGKEMGLEGRKGEVEVVRNRRVEDIKRVEGCGCEKEDCCEKETEKWKEERRSGGRVGLRFKLEGAGERERGGWVRREEVKISEE